MGFALVLTQLLKGGVGCSNKEEGKFKLPFVILQTMQVSFCSGFVIFVVKCKYPFPFLSPRCGGWTGKVVLFSSCIFDNVTVCHGCMA